MKKTILLLTTCLLGGLMATDQCQDERDHKERHPSQLGWLMAVDDFFKVCTKDFEEALQKPLKILQDSLERSLKLFRGELESLSEEVTLLLESQEISDAQSFEIHFKFEIHYQKKLMELYSKYYFLRDDLIRKSDISRSLRKISSSIYDEVLYPQKMVTLFGLGEILHVPGKAWYKYLQSCNSLGRPKMEKITRDIALQMRDALHANMDALHAKIWEKYDTRKAEMVAGSAPVAKK